MHIDGRWRTWRQVHEDTDRLAAGLVRLGVRKATRFAFISETSGPMVDLYFAGAKVGAVLLPLNVYLMGSFLQHQLSHSKASVVAVDEDGYAQVLNQLPDVRTIVTLSDFAVGPHEGIEIVRCDGSPVMTPSRHRRS